MTRIVIDTNVLVHSCNPNNAYFKRAVDFVEDVSSSTCLICIDEGLDPDEAQNRSRIWAEYVNHIPQDSLAQALLTELLLRQRVLEYAEKVPQQIHSEIRDKVADATDIVFVKVSYNSGSAFLVTHDFAAFPVEVREELRDLNISVIVDCYGAEITAARPHPTGK